MFVPALSLLGYVPSNAGVQDLVQSLTSAIARRSAEMMGLRLAAELLEASEGRGAAIKKRDEVHRMADANKAFSHFRF